MLVEVFQSLSFSWHFSKFGDVLRLPRFFLRHFYVAFNLPSIWSLGSNTLTLRKTQKSQVQVASDNCIHIFVGKFF